MTFSLSELNPVPTTPVYIHTGESISLDCTLGVIEEAAGSTDIKWYKDGTEVEELASVVVVTDHEYDGENKNQKITYVDTSVDKDDGGVYKCEYNFDHGDPISFEISVYVHCKFIKILRLVILFMLMVLALGFNYDSASSKYLTTPIFQSYLLSQF